MGLGGISISSLLLILLIVMVLFGTKKLRSVGSDLGGAIKSFKEGMNDADDTSANTSAQTKHHDNG